MKLDFRLSVEMQRNLGMVASRISSFMPDDFITEQMYKPSTHLLNGKSKLLRSTLVFIGADALGKHGEEYVDLAAAAELLHTASLIHDDIIDNEMIRRGKSAVHREYGTEAAILAGDALISKAIHLAAPYGARAMEEMSRSAMEMCAGELLDCSYQKSKKMPSVENYIRIADLKSASLIGTSCGIVATCLGDKRADELKRFGRYMGIAFQIRDDVLDSSDGKSQGTNIVKTLQDSKKKDALSEAKKMNEKYIEMAFGELKDKKLANSFKKYSAIVSVN